VSQNGRSIKLWSGKIYSAGVMRLCGDSEAADYSCQALKKFDGSVKHTLLRDLGYVPYNS